MNQFAKRRSGWEASLGIVEHRAWFSSRKGGNDEVTIEVRVRVLGLGRGTG